MVQNGKTIGELPDNTTLDSTELLEIQKGVGAGSSQKVTIAILAAKIGALVSSLFATANQGSKADSSVQTINGIAPDLVGDVELGNPYTLSGINDQTGTTYTLVATDLGKDVRCSNDATVALIVPSTVEFPVGGMIVYSQGGVGLVAATSDGTTIITGAYGTITTAPYDARVLEYLGDNIWRVW